MERPKALLPNPIDHGSSVKFTGVPYRCREWLDSTAQWCTALPSACFEPLRLKQSVVQTPGTKSIQSGKVRRLQLSPRNALGLSSEHKKFINPFLHMPRRLNNYLRTFRKRSGLSQKELSYLLGSKSASKVSRYEQSSRLPNLRTEMAFEAVFQSTARELFAGIFDEITSGVRKRAALLMASLGKAKPDSITNRKLQILRSIVGTDSSQTQA